MEIRENKQITESTVVGYKCDACKSKIAINDEYRFSNSHGEWDNDSCESHECHHVCSVKCYIKQIYRILDEWGEYKTLEIDGKPQWFIKQLIDLLPKI